MRKRITSPKTPRDLDIYKENRYLKDENKSMK
jgi:hypothetical protein